MIIQMLFARKRFLAHRAAERLIGRMAFHVALQTGIVRKHIVAHVAHKHLDTVMDLTVRGQIQRGGERLTAHLAHKLLAFVVIAPMHDVLILERKHFAANVARVHSRRRHGRRVAVIVNRCGRIVVGQIGGRRCGRCARGHHGAGRRRWAMRIFHNAVD